MFSCDRGKLHITAEVVHLGNVTRTVTSPCNSLGHCRPSRLKLCASSALSLVNNISSQNIAVKVASSIEESFHNPARWYHLGLWRSTLTETWTRINFYHVLGIQLNYMHVYSPRETYDVGSVSWPGNCCTLLSLQSKVSFAFRSRRFFYVTLTFPAHLHHLT